MTNNFTSTPPFQLTRQPSARPLFTPPRTFRPRSLGGLSGVPVARPKGWEPFQFAAGGARAGRLGQAGFLALDARTGRRSPTVRGRESRERVSCRPGRAPPGTRHGGGAEAHGGGGRWSFLPR